MRSGDFILCYARNDMLMPCRVVLYFSRFVHLGVTLAQIQVKR